MAYGEIKKGEDSLLYRQVSLKIDGRLNPRYGLDHAWAYAVDRRAEQCKEKLENEINGTGHYASCIEYLENLKPNLLVDIHLYDHVETLHSNSPQGHYPIHIRSFLLNLHTMAGAFRTTIAGLENELEALITEDQIQARIDSQNKILYARHADQRNATFQRVLQSGVEFDRDVRTMLLRSNLIKYENNLRASTKL